MYMHMHACIHLNMHCRFRRVPCFVVVYLDQQKCKHFNPITCVLDRYIQKQTKMYIEIYRMDRAHLPNCLFAYQPPTPNVKNLHFSDPAPHSLPSSLPPHTITLSIFSIISDFVGLSIVEMMEGFPSRISAAAHLDLPCLHNKIMLHKDGPGALSIRFIQFNQVEVETLHASPIPICSIPILCLPKQLRRVLLREGLSSNTDKVRASSKTAHLTAVIKDCLGCPNQSCHRRLPN